MSTVFGPLVAASKIERAFLAHLESWLVTYIAEVERQNDIDPQSIAPPKFYGTSVEADHRPGERLPSIIVVSPGTIDAPQDEGGGAISAWFQLTVVALVMAPDEMSVRDLAGYYAAAIRGAVLQHGSLDGQVEATTYDGEEYQGEPGDQRNRTRGAALVHFRVKVPSIVNRAGGPNEPTDYVDPPDLPIVQLVDIDTSNDE